MEIYRATLGGGRGERGEEKGPGFPIDIPCKYVSIPSPSNLMLGIACSPMIYTYSPSCDTCMHACSPVIHTCLYT